METNETHKSLVAKGTINKVRLNPHRTVLNVKRNEHVVNIREEKDDDNSRVWKSCCLRVDADMIMYLGQISVTTAVIGISTIMLIKADGDCSQSSAYIGLLSFILGKVLNNVQNNSNRR